jgi:hypothetical protein
MRKHEQRGCPYERNGWLLNVRMFILITQVYTRLGKIICHLATTTVIVPKMGG